MGNWRVAKERQIRRAKEFDAEEIEQIRIGHIRFVKSISVLSRGNPSIQMPGREKLRLEATIRGAKSRTEVEVTINPGSVYLSFPDIHQAIDAFRQEGWKEVQWAPAIRRPRSEFHTWP